MDLYDRIFKTEERVNANGCSVKGTFFVSHKFTPYSAVQELDRRGHEIAAFSTTSNNDQEYWTEGDYETWLAEMGSNRLILEKFANITGVDGMRAPYLLIGGNTQFQMMQDQFFLYDASITAPLSRVPVWPYTLQYQMPHPCHGNGGHCPTQSKEVWVVPINELDRRDDPDFDESLTGCHLVSSCSNIYSTNQFKRLLTHNLNRHLATNRAPLSLGFDAAWLQGKKDFAKALGEWIDDILLQYKDVYFVTHRQALIWMMDPARLNAINVYDNWKGEKCQPKGQPLCSLPNPCPVTSRELPGEVLRLHTCMACPNNYPWLLDPLGDGDGFN